MATEIKMPQLGLTMEEGTVERWLKAEGDPVKAGEPLLEITTDKLTNEVAAETDGVLLKIVAQEGADVPVKGLLGYIGRPGEQVGAPTAAAAPAAPAVEAAVAPNGPGTVLVIGGGPRLCGRHPGGPAGRQGDPGGAGAPGRHLPEHWSHPYQVPAAQRRAGVPDQGPGRGDRRGGGRRPGELPQVIAHKNAVSKQLTSGVAGLLKANKVVKIDGEASFTGPKTLSVKKSDGSVEEMTADAIIVATGSVNAQPPIPGLKENPNCIDSTGALSLEQLPKSMVVIGGGVIGLELACAYAAFGTKITVVEALDHMPPMLDGDLTKIGVAHMKKMGMAFNLECPVQAVEASPVGAKVTCRNKAGETVSFEAEKVLVAIGRKANTASLNLEVAGLANDRGRIIVNDKMETSVPGVYAIGDCVKGYAQLAHTASAMGEVAAENICGMEAHYDESTNPTCVYIEPEAASVGLTEEQAKAQGSTTWWASSP